MHELMSNLKSVYRSISEYHFTRGCALLGASINGARNEEYH